MKRIISVALIVMMLLSLAVFGGCSAKPLKMGLGVHAYVEKATSADADVNGEGQAVVAVAAVLLDAEGKIVQCALDTADNTVAFTSEGKFVEATEFKTKYEMGDNYGMVAYGKAAKEWYAQADAFEALVVGKTVDEVKVLVATEGKGTEDVINAGCTIAITDFVKAVEKAVAAATESKATANDTLKLGIVSTQTGAKDATAEAEGVNEVDTTVAAAAVAKDGKVTAMITDALQAKFAFDAKGVTATESGAAIGTKKEAGANYGMAQYGQDLNGDGTVKEWFEQAEAFNAACIGKTASELSALAVETGYGATDLQTAGCTIHIGDMVKAAVKAATVA